MKTSIPYDALDDCRFPLIPLGTIARYTTGWTPTSNDPVLYGGEHKWATISDLGNRFISNTQKTISDKAVEVQGSPEKSQPRDLMFSFKLSVGLVSIVEEPMFTNEAIATFKQSETLDLRFAYYALPVYLPANARPNIYGAPLLNADLISRAKVPLIDLETQRRIADYLDKEISEMDALIEEFEGLISSLESRRGVYLQTKFDPAITGDASMKMGIFAQISLGKTFQGVPKEGQDNAFPVNYVRAANIQPHGQLVLDEKTMYATQDEVEKYTLKAGDVVIVEGGAGFGRSFTLQEDLPGWIFQNHVIRMIPRSGWLGEFLDYTIRAHLYSGYIELQTVGATIPGLSSERAANLPVAFIPLEEQHKRVTEAREELSRMEALIEESTRLIENLKARKTALITEVVTGRKEV